ncbi:MAG: RNA methyltransferase [Firmicutes bacterium]|nr:RNA methyltransferase [Bacillota bacterium]
MNAPLITSKNNDQIKWIKKLNQRKFRVQERAYYVEGVRLTEEAVCSGSATSLFFTSRLLSTKRGKNLLERAQAQGVRLTECTESVFSEITDTVNSQGVLAIVRKRHWPFVLKGLLVVADEIQDPGNMGTLCRTAVAAGASGLIVTSGSVDPYNPKAVRSSMGGILHLPIWSMDGEEAVQVLEENNVPIIAADLEQAVDCFNASFPQTLALVVGNEARGVSELMLTHAQMRVKIPLLGPVESLNASVAAGILLYEIVRQRWKDEL